jgi:hypothetical protein
MVVNILILVLFVVAVGISISSRLDRRDKLAHPVFRKIFFFELFMYLATALMVLIISAYLFGPYTHWVLPAYAFIAPRFVRMGYPDFLKFWREGEARLANT